MRHPRRALLVPVVLLGTLGAPAGAGVPLAGAFVNVPLSVRQVGMGGIGVGPDDVLCGWSNPAVLGFSTGRGAIAVNGASLADGETGIGGGASWMIVPGAALAGLVSSYSESGTGVWAGGLALGFLAGDSLGAGLTVKGIADRAAQGTASALAVDVGLAASLEGFRGGLALRNAGRPLLNVPGVEAGREHVASEMRAEAVYTYARHRLSGGIDYSKLDGRNARIGVGAEWWPVSLLGIRTGITGAADEDWQYSAGLSVVFRRIGLDYAYASQPGGGSHRLALSCLFPGPAPAGERAAPARAEPAARKAARKTDEPASQPSAAAASPAVIDQMYQQAKDAYAAKRFAESRKWAQAVVSVDAQNWRAWALLGNSLYSLGDRPRAIGAYEHALAINPGNVKLRDWLNQLKTQK